MQKKDSIIWPNDTIDGATIYDSSNQLVGSVEENVLQFPVPLTLTLVSPAGYYPTIFNFMKHHNL